MIRKWIFLTLLSCALHGTLEALRCGKKYAWDNEDFFSCPRPQDPGDATFCCLTYCCNYETYSQKEMDFIGKSTNDMILMDTIPDLSNSMASERSLVKGLAKVIGIIISVILLLIVVLFICCCCCPFCLCAKRRREGQVLGQGDPNGQQRNPQQQPPPPSGYSHQQFPQSQYPPQEVQYPAAGYPPQPQNYPIGVQGYAPVPMDNPPPYQSSVHQPPTNEVYQKQPSFNPNY